MRPKNKEVFVHIFFAAGAVAVVSALTSCSTPSTSEGRPLRTMTSAPPADLFAHLPDPESEESLRLSAAHAESTPSLTTAPPTAEPPLALVTNNPVPPAESGNPANDTSQAEAKPSEAKTNAQSETKSSEVKPNEAKSNQPDIAALETRIRDLEVKLGSMNEKIEATRIQIESLNFGNLGSPGENSKASAKAAKLETVPVIAHPSQEFGIPVRSPASVKDPDSVFAHDEPIQEYRKASILYQAKKYPEAVLAYSHFVETYPDHVLAGSAQFYTGDAYFRQGQHKLAIREFQKVLTSYDRSAHISDTLHLMALSQERVQNQDEAARNKQLLTSLFPQSPAAARLELGNTSKDGTSSHGDTQNLQIEPAEAPATAPVGEVGT